MDSIYLVGFMGSGKSSVAEEVEKQLNLPLFDTDQIIEEKTNKKITEIFAEDGEAVFRDLETAVLKDLPSTDAIISTGGGIVERQENQKFLKEQLCVIFLDASWETITKRLSNDTNRPIWLNKDRDKQKLLESRKPIYKSVATLILKTDNKEPDELASEIITHIKG
ncbi:shikimate kinase [Saliterribacillus persicus]|uniref:Shikimate kinase n=1 Tax=Saliterribacillus persicus TaxID=930114 RepID=A0A368XDT6_9BACI|nr:shikimate kinase [Saliterribacillus persicus]RCW65386.1 shikimate kinase [Saliterribacillus persicus]